MDIPSFSLYALWDQKLAHMPNMKELWEKTYTMDYMTDVDYFGLLNKAADRWNKVRFEAECQLRDIEIIRETSRQPNYYELIEREKFLNYVIDRAYENLNVGAGDYPENPIIL